MHNCMEQFCDLTLSPSDFLMDIHNSAENASSKEAIRYTPMKLFIKLFAIH